MATLRRAPTQKELEALERIFLQSETEIINEIGRLRSQGLVDYHAVAALERVQEILQDMGAKAGKYVPAMVEKMFYVRVPEARKMVLPPETPQKHLSGYINAVTLTGRQTEIVKLLTANLLGEIDQASVTAMARLTEAILGRQQADIFRTVGLYTAARMQATGRSVSATVPQFVATLQRQGVAAFTDRAGRNWSLHDYANMVCRATSRQAEIAAILTADEEHDLYQISRHGTTCGLCAPFEGRVYSKSGNDPDFPPLADAFGKIDKFGGNILTNTYLNIHPNCLVGGGTVLAEGVMAHTCRDYDGEVITLSTSTGNQITVTPNHPILTTKGFVAAGLLHEGDKIVETTSGYCRFLGEAPNNIHVPTRVEEIGHALMQARCCSALSVEGSSVQFHGDGIPNRKVNIIFPDGFGEREGNVLGREPAGKKRFPSARLQTALFFSLCSPFEVFIGALNPAYSVVGGSGLIGRIKAVPVQGEQPSNVRHRFSALLSDFRVGKALFMKRQKAAKLFGSLFDISGRDVQKTRPLYRLGQTVVSTSAYNGIRFNTKIFGDLSDSEPLLFQRLQSLLRDNALVVVDLVHVSTSVFSGKVYNLETKYGFYSYNNIVTHNCLHVILPWTPMGRSEEEIQRIKDFSNPALNPYSVDPRSQKQIDAYRKKEEARRHWLADYKQWERYRITLGKQVPSSFAAFQSQKKAGSAKYQQWQSAYRKARREEEDADLS